MSFPLLANTVARAFPQGLDDDELERQRRVKRAATDPGVIAPEARLYGEGPPRVTPNAAPPGPQPSIARVAPVVDVTAGSDGVFRRAGEAPAPNTLSVPSVTAPMRATYEPQATQTAPPDRQHVDFGQPNPMDALAVQRAGANPPPFASDVDEGPATRRAREMGEVGAEPHQHGSGLGERLIHGLKLGGSAFLRSGFNPLIAAGEFAEGAIDPNAWHRYEFNRDYPRAVTAAHNEQGMQEADLQRQLQRAGVTGELPGGTPTLPYREFQQRQDALNQQRQWQRNTAQEKATETERFHKAETERKTTADKNRFASQRLNTLRHVYEAGGMNEQQRQEFASLAGVSGALGEAYQKGEADIQPDEKGRLFVVHKRTGYKEPVVDPDTGQQMISFKVTEEANKTARASATQDRIDRRATMRGSAAGRMTRAQAETQAAKALGADERGLIDNPQWKDAYDHAYAVFDYEKDDVKRQASAARQADRTVKAGKRIPANKHPEFHLKVQGLMGGQTGGQGASRSLSQADIKAYADVNYGGDVAKARVRIAGDHPDWRLP